MSCSERATSASPGIFAEIAREQAVGRRSVLATPLWSSGSVPLGPGSKLLYREDGSFRGTIGGGTLEARVLAAAPEVLTEDRARTLEFELAQDEAAAGGMICGGRCAILLEPVAPDRDAAVFSAAAAAEEAGTPLVLVTLIGGDGVVRKLALRKDDEIVGEPPEAGTAEAVRELGRRALTAGRGEFVERPIRAHFDPLLPRPTVFIFGAGHVAVPVAQLACMVGFQVVVVDDRAELASRQRFPWADQVTVSSVQDAFREIGVSDTGYVVAVTRGHVMDEEVVAAALKASARYIGMIGSRRKVAAVRERLRRRGFAQADLDRIHAPIGLAIKAQTVEEIAVSIVAELIAVRRSLGEAGTAAFRA